MACSVWNDVDSGREAVTEEEVLSFIETARDEEGERWDALRRRRWQAMPEGEILRALSGDGGNVEESGSSIFPTLRVSDVPVRPHALEYVDRESGRRRTRVEQGEIGTLPVVMRVMRVAVWLATGVLMVVGMLMR